MRIVPPTTEGLEEATKALGRGAIVAYPTETVYGLGVDPFCEKALHAVHALKGRGSDKAMLLIIADESHLDRVAAWVSPAARAYIKAFWPGPLSMLFPKAPGLPSLLANACDRVCVRCTPHPTARQLCERFGGAIISTSANPSGHAPARSLWEITLNGIDVGIDGGTLPECSPSTVFDPDTGEILREGAVSAAALRDIAVP